MLKFIPNRLLVYRLNSDLNSNSNLAVLNTGNTKKMKWAETEWIRQIDSRPAHLHLVSARQKKKAWMHAALMTTERARAPVTGHDGSTIDDDQS
jgi:hypothetical protein